MITVLKLNDVNTLKAVHVYLIWVEEIYKTTIMLESEFNAKGMNRYSCKQQKYNRHGEV